MELKTSQEILDMMEEADEGRAVTDGTHWDVKWVSLESLKKKLHEVQEQKIDYEEFCRLLNKEPKR